MNNYKEQAKAIAKEIGLKMSVKYHDYAKHFENDEQERAIFKVTLRNRLNKSYTFKFGQSLAKGFEEPNLYDVLACLQKYEVRSFEDFCGEFGYSNDSRRAERTYKAVKKEYENMTRLFSESEMEKLREIQ